MTTLLNINNLRVSYKGTSQPVIHDLSLTLKRGKVLGVVGESGCGKTTLANAIIGALPDNGVIEQGEICFQGKDLLTLTEQERRAIQGNELGMIVQASLSSLNPVRRIGTQFVQLIREKKGLSKADAKALAEEYLRKMRSPEDTLRKFPFQLSGGQRQRVIIAMAFALHPELLVADEPTTALDVTIQAQVLNEMMKLQEAFETGILLISHNLGVIAQVCDEIAVMYDGEIVEYGPADHVLHHPKHPYTIGLINSIPDMTYPRTERLYAMTEAEKQQSMTLPQQNHFTSHDTVANISSDISDEGGVTDEN